MLPAAIKDRDHVGNSPVVVAVPRVCAPALVATAELPAEADLSNVVPFARRVFPPEANTPDMKLAPQDRPAPPSPPVGAWRELALALTGVLMLHAGLYAAFNRAPPPQASVGVEVMSVEIVLGANEAAGLEKTKGESSVTSRASSGNDQPEQRQQTLRVEKDAGPGEKVVKDAKVDATGTIPSDSRDVIAETKPMEAKPVEQAVAREVKVAAAPKPEASQSLNPVAREKPRETAKAAQPEIEAAALKAAHAATVENEPEPIVEPDAIEVAKSASPAPSAAQATASEAKPTETKSAEAKPVTVKPAETEIEPVEVAAVAPDVVKPIPEPQRPQAVLPKPRPETAPDAKPVRAAAPASKRQQKAKRATRSRTKDNARASTPSVAASGVGRGRSAASSNYRGLVSAHLARHKRHTHGSSGTATVAFNLSGGGKVTSARLVRGSGVAGIDQEAVAMVRRASPFPAPPDGRATSFTVPLRFVVQ